MPKFPTSGLAALVLAAGLSGGAALADPIGALDSPKAGQSFSGVIQVSGFVLDFAGIDKVEVWVDGALRSRAQTNIARPDCRASRRT